MSDNMEKAPTGSNLSITSNDINIELSKEFLVELIKNIYHGAYNEDVVDHIAKVLKMVDLIYVPGVDYYQLRMKVFPLSLADDAKEWWIKDEMLDEGNNWEIDPLKFLSNVNTSFKNHKKIDGRTKKITRRKSDTEKEDEQSQTKRKHCNTSNSIDEQPNKRRCKAKKFEAIQYSLGPNEEYIALRRYEFDIWERNEDNLSIIYQDIFQKKDEGWKDLGSKEISTNIGGKFTNLEDLEVLES
ncbi:hypothetical protein Tco_1488742 [Tanacetum coccineum]